MRKKVMRCFPDWFEELCCNIGYACICGYLIGAGAALMDVIIHRKYWFGNKEKQTEKIDTSDPNCFKEVV